MAKQPTVPYGLAMRPRQETYIPTLCEVCAEGVPVTTQRDGIPCCAVCAEAWDDSFKEEG
jgi:hypothetical protein